MEKLNYKGEVKITKGVGIINKSINEKDFSCLYRRNFLYLGRLSSEKNIDLLLNVFEKLTDFKLTIAGDGPLRDRFEKVSSNISFLGHVENKALPDLFERHDFLILPSLKETWGLVVEESLFFGRPVIMSDKCGSVDLIKNGVNGYTFDPLSEKSLTEILLNLNQKKYDGLISGVKEFNIEIKDKYQVSIYENTFSS